MDRKETERNTIGTESLSRSGGRTGVEAPSRATLLLREGEAFFADGRLEEAVHLWTRVLFLDRGNREARKKIDEAKGVLAERQRLLDAQVVEARGLFEACEVEPARAVLRSVLSVDPRHTEAMRLSEDIAAFERRAALPSDERGRQTIQPSESATSPTQRQSAAPSPPRSSTPGFRPEASSAPTAPGGGVLLRVSRRRARPTVSPSASPLKVAAFLLGVSIAVSTGALFLYYNWESIVSDGTAAGAEVGKDRVSAVGLGSTEATGRRDPAVPDLAELRYYNGARLFDKGRYREALAELERIDRSSAVASRARSLILRIEERLLRGAEEPDTEDEEP